MDFDVVVAGSGIAGLSFAIDAAEAGLKTCIVTKKGGDESNTNYAQGGIACVTSESDDFERHIEDTMTAGAGLCDSEVVREVVKDGPARIEDIQRLGVEFSKLSDGRVSLGKEGGHSKRRILHVEDMTGRAIEKAYLDAVRNHPNIDMREHSVAIDLITLRKIKKFGYTTDEVEDRVVGLYTYDDINNKVETLRAKAVVLATGGIGYSYQYTTNPEIATGDGIAMAYRAGVEVRNMEFIQFHPTALFTNSDERFLISEAVRGEGAVLRDHRGQAFMKKYHPLKELAPRDVVARAIDSVMKKTGDQHLWLDSTGIPSEKFKERFPNILAACERIGVNPSQDWIPVVPAAHYLCGGIRTNLDAETTLKGLFACGEVACTGLHGGNRLASNSLLEAVVMAHRGAQRVIEFSKSENLPTVEVPEWVDGNVQDSDERGVLAHSLDELKRAMWDYVGIVRTTKRLERARTRIQNLAREINDYYWNFKVETKLIELRNMIQIADLIVQSALQRRESRGLHYTLDYPSEMSDPHDTILRRG
ncbi:MAG: L-aspartate oxidase [Opitutales bacterium]|nr:L-aspartate oxidase [Opitutales bacterium]